MMPRDIQTIAENLQATIDAAQATRQAAAEPNNPHWLTLLIAILEAALSFLKNFPTTES
jgi:hypothetical protein